MILKTIGEMVLLVIFIFASWSLRYILPSVSGMLGGTVAIHIAIIILRGIWEADKDSIKEPIQKLGSLPFVLAFILIFVFVYGITFRSFLFSFLTTIALLGSLIASGISATVGKK